jgi:hypothetical protein
VPLLQRPGPGHPSLVLHLLASIGYAITLAGQPAEPAAPVEWLSGGSVYRSSTFHLGLRPAVDVTNDGPSWGVGFTGQITCKTPW